MNKIVRTATLAFVLAATAAVAQDTTITGEVRKIDAGAGKITLKHGPAPSLGMDEGMTMVYRIKDPAWLKGIKVGDKVKFEAESTDGSYTVTKLQKSK